MMEAFIHALLGVSLAGGIFILAGILVRSGVKHRLPKHFLVLLWAAVLLRLLSPFELPSPTSIYNYVVLRGGAGPGQAVSPAAVPDSAAGGSAPAGISSPRAPGPGAAGGNERLLRTLFYVWAFGAGAFLILFLGGYAAARRRFAPAFLLKNNPVIDNWLKRRRHPPRVYLSDRTTTPLSYGLLSPCIVLPSGFDLSDAAQVESVLEHECVHSRNYHNAMKFLVCLSLVLHWFNPLVWIYWLLFNHDLELACDEQVIGAIGPERRAEYAHSLVAVAERAIAPFPPLSAFSVKSLKERIVDVMGYKRTTATLLAMEILLAACLFSLFGTTAATGGGHGSSGARDPETAARPAFPGWSYAEGTEPLAAALSFAGGVAVKQEIEVDKGRTEYEFEILSDGREYKMTIDPHARSVIEFEQKGPTSLFAGVDLSRFITMEQAVRSARESAAGGVVSECELKHVGSGRFVYVIEISANDGKRKVMIDAVSGRESGAGTGSGKRGSPTADFKKHRK